ncbi:hypothetical protein Tco_0446660 [Tanacetum coccineum]
MSESSKLLNESYVLYDRVMNTLTAHQERKTRKDHGTRRGHHSISSSSAFDQPSSSHLDDDDDGNGKGTSRAITPSPVHFVNSLTNDVPQIQDEHLKVNWERPQKLVEEHEEVPPRPSNPQPLQSHPYLDITLSLSPFENLETPSPPYPP